MADFNTAKWQKHRLAGLDGMPEGPHFQAIVFGHHQVMNPRYDERDGRGGPPSHTDACTNVFVFQRLSDLEAFVTDASRTTTPFAFFHVPVRGKIQTQIDTGYVPPRQHRDGYDPREGNLG